MKQNSFCEGLLSFYLEQQPRLKKISLGCSVGMDSDAGEFSSSFFLLTHSCEKWVLAVCQGHRLRHFLH